MYTTDHIQIKILLDKRKNYMETLFKYFGIVMEPHQFLIKDLNDVFCAMYERICPMARRRKNNQRDLEFVNINLSRDEQVQFKNWYETKEFDLGELLQECIYDGGKVSLNYNSDRKSFYASLIFVNGSGLNSGLGFSAHAGDPQKALVLMAYKYLEICQRELRIEDELDSEFDFG